MGPLDLFSRSIVSNNADHALVESFSTFVAILCFCIVVGHLFVKSRWINESIAAILIGSVTGTIILFWSKGTSSHILRFDEELFFIYLLPPIIFNAGFQVKKKQFFRNFFTIMQFGVVGVFISFAIISAGGEKDWNYKRKLRTWDYASWNNNNQRSSWWFFPKIGFKGLNARDFLALGVIFSSTDTVCTLQVLCQDETPRLYSLVFGEGVVNDATSVVLFNTIQKINGSKLDVWVAGHVFVHFLYLFSTSTILGIVTGLLTAYALKSLYFSRHSTDREIALMSLMAYFSYLLAELLQLSGILTVFFCGIVMSHYAWHNVSENSRVTTRHIFATLSFIAETFIFLYVGMDALDIEKWQMIETSLGTSLSIYFIIILLIMVGRAAFVFPLSTLSNYLNPNAESPPITLRHQVIIWWAGLMRGAVSIALAFNQFTFSGIASDPTDATMMTSTVVVVLFTTLVFGFLTKPLISYLLPRHAQEQANQQNAESSKGDDDITLPLLAEGTTMFLHATGSLQMLLERPVHTIHAYWRQFDDTYMRPIFGGPS